MYMYNTGTLGKRIMRMISIIFILSMVLVGSWLYLEYHTVIPRLLYYTLCGALYIVLYTVDTREIFGADDPATQPRDGQVSSWFLVPSS